jgi:hypothetical protein
VFRRATAARLSNPLWGICITFLRLRLDDIAAYCRHMQAVCPPPALFHSWGAAKPLLWLYNFHYCYASPRQPRLVSSEPMANTNSTNVITIIYRASIFFYLITMNLNRWGSWGVTIKAKQFNNITPPPSRGVPPPSRGFAHEKAPPQFNEARR